MILGPSFVGLSLKKATSLRQFADLERVPRADDERNLLRRTVDYIGRKSNT